MAKIKKIKTIGGFKVKDLFAPQIQGVIQDKKGNLVNRKTGEVYATHKEILKEKQRYQRLVKSDNFELGGERYKNLTREEKQTLKKWGFTKSDLKKLSFTNKYSEAMRKSGGSQIKSGVLKFSDILYKKKVSKVTKIDKKTGEVKEVIKVTYKKEDKKVKDKKGKEKTIKVNELRKQRRSPKQNLYSGKKAVESRKKFISGQTYKDKLEQYKNNYLSAIQSGGLKGNITNDIKEALIYAINNIANFDKFIPDLEDNYKGYELHPQDYTDKTGKIHKGQTSTIKDMVFYKAYKYIEDIENNDLKIKIYGSAFLEFSKNPNLEVKDSKYYKAYRQTANIKDNNLRAELFDKYYEELLKE